MFILSFFLTIQMTSVCFFFFSSRRRHTRWNCDWSSDVCSSDLSNFEVLRAATIHGAEAIGYGKDLGSIEPGKMADLIVLNKDPLLDIHNTNTIRYVMKNGELFEGDTLNQTWPVQKPLADLWWWKTKP